MFNLEPLIQSSIMKNNPFPTTHKHKLHGTHLEAFLNLVLLYLKLYIACYSSFYFLLGDWVLQINLYLFILRDKWNLNWGRLKT